MEWGFYIKKYFYVLLHVFITINLKGELLMPSYDDVKKFVLENGKCGMKSKKIKNIDGSEGTKQYYETVIGKADFKDFMKVNGITDEMIQKMNTFSKEFGENALKLTANTLIDKKDEFDEPLKASAVLRVLGDIENMEYKVLAHTLQTIPNSSDKKEVYGDITATRKVKASFLSNELCDEIGNSIKNAFEEYNK